MPGRAILDGMMRTLRVFRQRDDRLTTQRPRANPTRIAVLEHDLLGIQPEPGSVAALAVGLRRAGTCIEHKPIQAASSSTMCTGCGRTMHLKEDGTWRTAT
jgi:hypothetical protein